MNSPNEEKSAEIHQHNDKRPNAVNQNQHQGAEEKIHPSNIESSFQKEKQIQATNSEEKPAKSDKNSHKIEPSKETVNSHHMSFFEKVKKSEEKEAANSDPMIFSKIEGKRFDNEREFRKFISMYEKCSNEIIFLYQNDAKKDNIKDQIIENLNILNNTCEKLIHSIDQKEKIKVINDFYQKNDFHNFLNSLVEHLYRPAQKYPSEIQGINTKKYFQDFDPSLGKTEIKFDSVKFIQPPKVYSKKLNQEMIDKYDKFVSIVNLIITVQKIIDFKEKFEQQNKSLDQDEKKSLEDEIRRDEEKKLKYKEEELKEEKEKIKKEEELLIEDEKNRGQASMNDIDQQIKEKKNILLQLKESITSMQTQINAFEKRKNDLEQKYKAMEKEKAKLDGEMSSGFNDLLKCLKDTQKKEKKIESMLQQPLPKSTNSGFTSSQSLESLTFINMSKSEKEDYFNNLVNKQTDDKYDIKVKDFCTLTENISFVTESQFEYMINYYNHKHIQKDDNCKFIFKNLKVMSISMIQRIYELKDFSAEYLSKEVLNKLVHRSLLVDKLMKNFEKILFVKDKTDDEREKLIKECKKEYYSIYNITSNEVFIYKNTKIIESLFFNGYNIEKVVIPDSVVEIQDNAFYDCKNLKTVVLNGNKLKVIGKSAFSGCTNLVHFDIPEKVKVIHSCTFLGCQSLTNVGLPLELEEICGKAFSGCKSLIKMKLPKTCRKIGKGAFEKCSSLQVFVIPGVLSIYRNGKQPKGINDETSIQNFKINAKCFNKCTSFQNIMITNKCYLIDQFAFSSCSKLETITYSLTTESKVGIYSFSDCSKLRQATFNVNKNSSLEFSDYSFINCKELNEVVINNPELLANDKFVVDSNVFNGCEKLKKFVFPPNCNKNIGECCFEKCKNLESVTLPNEMKYISKNMFKGCELLSSVNLDNTITKIDVSAFENCAKLQLEQLPQNLVKIGDNAFSNCASLSIKQFPEKLEEIGEDAFQNCSNLIEIVFPPSMKIIQKKAFENCTQLEAVTIYSQSIQILKKAFLKCSNLKKIFAGNRSGISSEAFKECAKGLDFFGLDS